MTNRNTVLYQKVRDSILGYGALEPGGHGYLREPDATYLADDVTEAVVDHLRTVLTDIDSIVAVVEAGGG
jgi:hypothetical protein